MLCNSFKPGKSLGQVYHRVLINACSKLLVTVETGMLFFSPADPESSFILSIKLKNTACPPGREINLTTQIKSIYRTKQETLTWMFSTGRTQVFLSFLGPSHNSESSPNYLISSTAGQIITCGVFCKKIPNCATKNATAADGQVRERVEITPHCCVIVSGFIDAFYCR